MLHDDLGMTLQVGISKTGWVNKRTAEEGHEGWQSEGQPEYIGFMKLYILRYSQTEWSVGGHSQ